jgi:hypothetical protein
MLSGVSAAVIVHCVLLVVLVRAQGPFTFAGMDFLTSYTGAEIVADGNAWQLYDTRAQWEYQRDITGAFGVEWPDRVMHPYIAPPMLAIAAMPLLLFGPLLAAALWSLSNLVAVALGCGLLVRRLNIDWRVVLVVIGGSLPLFYTVLLGQVEGFLFLALVLFIIWLRAGHETRAGLALAVLAIKPPLLLAPLLYLLVTRRYRAFAVAASATAVQGIASMAVVGPQGVRDFLALSQRLSGPDGSIVTNVWGMVNIRSIVVRALPEDDARLVSHLIIVVTAAVLYGAIWFWRRATSERVDLASLAMLFVTMVLTSYHALYHTTLLALLGVVLLVTVIQRSGDVLRTERLLLVTWVTFTLAPLLSFVLVPTSKVPALIAICGLVICWCLTLSLAVTTTSPRVPTPQQVEVPVRSRSSGD